MEIKEIRKYALGIVATVTAIGLAYGWYTRAIDFVTWANDTKEFLKNNFWLVPALIVAVVAGVIVLLGFILFHYLLKKRKIAPIESENEALKKKVETLENKVKSLSDSLTNSNNSFLNVHSELEQPEVLEPALLGTETKDNQLHAIIIIKTICRYVNLKTVTFCRCRAELHFCDNRGEHKTIVLDEYKLFNEPVKQPLPIRFSLKKSDTDLLLKNAKFPYVMIKEIQIESEGKVFRSVDIPVALSPTFALDAW